MGLFKSIGKIVKGVLGMDTGKDLAKAQQAQLDALKRQQQLDASQEAADVAQFDDITKDTFAGTDTRRKRQAGNNMFGNVLGIKVV